MVRRSRPIAVGAGLALVLTLGLSACGGDDGADDDSESTAAADSPGTTASDGGGSATSAGEEPAIVGASDFTFTEATARAGQTVRLNNADSATHTVVSDDDAWTYDEATESFTAPSEPGSYAFHCGIHPSMTGTLTVEA